MSEVQQQKVCPNCQESFSESYNFCPNCGQDNVPSTITFKELVSDFLGSLISFDAKVFTTIPKLLFKPGKLTKEYIEGKRQSQLSPFRLYLFLSVILILLLTFTMKDNSNMFNFDSDKISQSLDSLNMIIKTDSTIDVDSLKSLSFAANNDSNGTKVSFSNADIEELEALNTANKMIKQGYTLDEVSDSLLQDFGLWRRISLKQALKLQHREGAGMLGVFVKTASYGMFLFLPLFALLLKLFYVRRKRLYIEHFIFTLHFYSFIFFLFILFILIRLIPINIPWWIMLSIILIYLYIAMFKVYNQSWIKTFFKQMALLFTTIAIIGPLMMLLVLLVSFFFY